MSLLFRIWYGDGSTYEGDPYYAPRIGVQVIVGRDPANGRYTVSDKDAYWWVAKEDRWRGGDRHGEFIYMLRLGPRVVLWGEQVSDEQYNTALAAAHADGDFPPRTAWGRGERAHQLSVEGPGHN